MTELEDIITDDDISDDHEEQPQPSKLSMWWQSIQKPKKTHCPGQTKRFYIDKMAGSPHWQLYLYLIVFMIIEKMLSIVAVLKTKNYNEDNP